MVPDYDIKREDGKSLLQIRLAGNFVIVQIFHKNVRVEDREQIDQILGKTVTFCDLIGIPMFDFEELDAQIRARHEEVKSKPGPFPQKDEFIVNVEDLVTGQKVKIGMSARTLDDIRPTHGSYIA